jgi:hypothetical protein
MFGRGHVRLPADGEWRVPERACLRRGRGGGRVPKGAPRPKQPALLPHVLVLVLLRLTVSRPCGEQLDAAARAMGGGHVLFDRKDPPASPLEQVIGHCLSKAEDTARCCTPVRSPAWRVRPSACAHTALSRHARTAHAAGMPSTGGVTNGCRWTRTATPTKCSRALRSSCAIRTLATCCTSASASRCVNALAPCALD